MVQQLADRLEHFSGRTLLILYLRQEILADAFVRALNRLQDHDHRDHDEDVCVAILDQLIELWVFLTETFKSVRKVDKLVANLIVQKEVLPSLPVLFVQQQLVDKILVVLELGVNDFDVEFELSEKTPFVVRF